MHSHRSKLRLACAAAGAALLAAGCGLFGNDDLSIAEELRYLPDPGGEPMTIYATDFSRVAEMVGTDKPTGSDADFDELAQWFAPATYEDVDGAVWPILPRGLGWDQNVGSMEPIDEGLGVSLRHVTGFAEVYTGPHSATVVHGDYETERITEALGDPEDGVWAIGEDGAMDITQTDVLPPVGYGLRLAERDDRLLLSRRSDHLDQMRESEGTLDDNEPVVAIAEALDSVGWLSLQIEIGRSFEVFTPEREMFDLDEDAAVLDPFSALAIAVDYDDGTGLMHLVYDHEDEETAQANADVYEELVEQTIYHRVDTQVSEFLDLAETDVDGTLLIVTFEITDDNPNVAWNLWNGETALTMHR